MENTLLVESLEEFDRIEKPSNMKKFKLQAKCTECEKVFDTSYYNINCDKLLLCRKHKIERTHIKNYGSVEAAIAANVSHGQTTRKKNDPDGKKWQQKVQSTMESKYGVKNPGQMEDHTEKCKKTLEEHYGSVEEGYTKMGENSKKTKIERYGEDYAKDIWKKICDDMGVENISQTEEWKQKHLKKSCERISKFANIIERDGKYFLHCEKCGKDHEQKTHDVWTRCFDCYPLNSYDGSIVEKELKEFLNTITSVEKKRSIFKENNHLEVDCFDEKNRIGFELDGVYWHKSFEKNSSLEKFNLAKNNNFRLVRIFNTEWTEKNTLVKNYLKSLYGIYEKRIFARKCTVKEIDNKVYNNFCDENHLQGSVNASVKIGLFYENELIQVMSFAKPRYNRKYDWEMMRECSKSSYSIIGGKSKLFSYFVKKYQPQNIISYCEKRLFTGSSYEKLGFKKQEDSSPNFFVLWKGNTYSRAAFTKVNMQKLKDFKYDSSLTQFENMLENNAYPVWDCGNYVFTWEN